VLELLSPALSSWTAFLLCRHLTRRLWPSLIGGYLFGFSPFVLSSLRGAPNVGFVAILPLLVVVVLLRLDDRISPPRFVASMTLLLAAQYLIGSELLATSTLSGAVALMLGYALMSDRRAALISVAKYLLLSYAAAGILIAPFLYYFLFGQHYPPRLVQFPADLVAFVVPPDLVAVPRHVISLTGTDPEDYLGLPLIALIVAFTWTERHRRATWLIVLSVLIAVIFSLGGHVVVRTHQTAIPGPWLVLEHLPVLRYAFPGRLSVFIVLPAALAAALWLSWVPGRGQQLLGRAALTVLAIAAIVPDVGNSVFHTPVGDPPFFSTGMYRRYLSATDHVLTIPVLGPNERWVADAGFPFALTAGYAGQRFPEGYTRFPIWTSLVTGVLPKDYAYQLRRFLAAKHVTALAIDSTVPGPWRRLFGTLGIRPVPVGGVFLYRLAPPAPSRGPSRAGSSSLPNQ